MCPYVRDLSILTHRRWRVFVCLIAVMASAYSVFFAWRANLDIENPLLLRVVSVKCVCNKQMISFSYAWTGGTYDIGTA